MAHHNFYDSLGLDRGKDAEALGAEIDQRLQSPSLSHATRDELQVARRILGDSGRRKLYDTRLDDPSAPTLDVSALRQMAAAEPGPAATSSSPFASGAGSVPGSAPEPHEPEAPKESKRDKPKQYFPDTDPNAEAVSPAQGAAPNWPAGGYSATTNIPVYQGPATSSNPGQGQGPGQYGFQVHNPGQPQYTYPTQQAGPVAQPAPADTAAPEKKKGTTPLLVAAIVLLLLAIAAGGWWLWNNRGTEWEAAEQDMADTFPQIISEKDGQSGWLGMKCTSLPPSNGEEARIRCADNDLGVSIMDFGSEAERDAQLPEGDTEVIGNNVCSARSYEMQGVTPPAYLIAPEGADAQYLLLVNGDDAESKRMYLNLCEKSRG